MMTSLLFSIHFYSIIFSEQASLSGSDSSWNCPVCLVLLSKLLPPFIGIVRQLIKDKQLGSENIIAAC